MLPPADASTPVRPRRSRWSRRFHAVVYLSRRLVWLLLQAWAVTVCAHGLAFSERKMAAAAGLLLGGAALVLYVRWMWGRYGHWVRKAEKWWRG